MNVSRPKENRSLSLDVLSDRQIKDLHAAVLNTLECTGIVFQHDKALEILRSIGCKVEKDKRVKIPPSCVEEALKLSPSLVNVYDRKGELRMKLGTDQVYFGAGGSCPYVAKTDGSFVPFTLAECARNARVADALANIDFYMAMGHCCDAPTNVRDVREILAVLDNTVKPIIVASNTAGSLNLIVEMCGIVSGSKPRFLDKPYLIYYTEPVSPLQHTHHSLDKLFTAIDYGLPLLNTPAPMAGGTAPITLCGTLISGVAELLSGLVLIQNYKKGTPVIFGGVFTTLDMKGMVFSYGSPELQLMNTAIAQLARFYQIPSFGTAGATDSHTLDAQTAFECGISILLNALSGSNLVHDVGWMSSAQATSNELMVLCDEMIGYTRRYLSGINIDLLEVSTAELQAVGPGGSFVDRDLTLQMYKTEVWYPQMMKRIAHKLWVNSREHSLERQLKDRVDQIISEHPPAHLNEEGQRNISALIRAFEAKSSG